MMAARVIGSAGSFSRASIRPAGPSKNTLPVRSVMITLAGLRQLEMLTGVLPLRELKCFDLIRLFARLFRQGEYADGFR